MRFTRTDGRTVGLACLLGAATIGFDWPQFRGPNAGGVAEETNLPVVVGPEENVVWKAPLPAGPSSPSIGGGEIFLTGVENGKLLTFALDRDTGRVLWRREAPRPRRQELHDNNHPASPTPATDGRNVYVFFADFGLLAYVRREDLRGERRGQGRRHPGGRFPGSSSA